MTGTRSYKEITPKHVFQRWYSVFTYEFGSSRQNPYSFIPPGTCDQFVGLVEIIN